MSLFFLFFSLFGGARLKSKIFAEAYDGAHTKWTMATLWDYVLNSRGTSQCLAMTIFRAMVMCWINKLKNHKLRPVNH